MNRTIEANEMHLVRLFSSESEQFIIPVYQRQYMWGNEQWSDLWNDIANLDKDDDHFLGSIVVINPPHSIELNQYEVVDGQQRLTTLSLLLAALRDCLIAHDGDREVRVAESINKYLHAETMFESGFTKIVPGKFDVVDYTNIIDKKSKSNGESNVWKAYLFFKVKIQFETDLLNFTKKVMESLKVVLIRVMSHKDAFRLFETLNDRGLSLSATDLIKNYILSQASRQSDSSIQDVVDCWEEIVENLNGLDSLRFLRQAMLSQFDGVFSLTKLYDKYKSIIDASSSIADFVEELKVLSTLYKQIVTGTTYDQKINLKLKDIIDVEISTSYTLILKLLHNKIDSKKIINILNSIEIFAIRRSICNWSTSNLDPIFNHLANQVNKIETIDEYVKSYLFKQEHIPSDDEFINNIKIKNFRQDDFCKYILTRIEDYSVDFNQEKMISDRSKVHIEHIMPKSITSKKSKEWYDELKDKTQIHKEYINKIGNLTLLGASLNIQASNNSFNVKKTYYTSSIITITKSLCEYGTWGFDEIEKRSQKFAEICKEVWSLN